jgi:hypothetical protein
MSSTSRETAGSFDEDAAAFPGGGGGAALGAAAGVAVASHRADIGFREQLRIVRPLEA